MTQTPRKPIRLDAEHYREGVFMITYCVTERRPILAKWDGPKLSLTAAGHHVLETWLGLPSRYPHVSLDVLAVMPDHVHGILAINVEGWERPIPWLARSIDMDWGIPNGAASSAATGEHSHAGTDGAASSAATDEHANRSGAACCAGEKVQEAGLIEIVRAFKSISAIEINRTLGRTGQPVWQRRFHDRKIRSWDGLNTLREYVLYNPNGLTSTQFDPPSECSTACVLT